MSLKARITFLTVKEFLWPKISFKTEQNFGAIITYITFIMLGILYLKYKSVEAIITPTGVFLFEALFFFLIVLLAVGIYMNYVSIRDMFKNPNKKWLFIMYPMLSKAHRVKKEYNEKLIEAKYFGKDKEKVKIKEEYLKSLRNLLKNYFKNVFFIVADTEYEKKVLEKRKEEHIDSIIKITDKDMFSVEPFYITKEEYEALKRHIGKLTEDKKDIDEVLLALNFYGVTYFG